MNKPALYLIPTPLSPEGETLPEVKKVIQSLRYFLVENVRTARRFISSLELGVNISELEFNELSKRTDPKILPSLMQPLKNGYSMGVMSEAGAPGIADPGMLATTWCHQERIRVKPLVGPSSFTLALMASGLQGQSFRFHGYLPIEERAKARALKQMESRISQESQIFMETPYRNNQLIDLMKQELAKGTRLCIAADLTGERENIQTKTVSEWQEVSVDYHKVPVVFILGK